MARTPTPANAGDKTDSPIEVAAPEVATASAQDPANVADNSEVDGLTVEVRVLRAFGGNEPNSVISVAEAALPALVRDGDVDANPDAVAYAKSLSA